MELTFVRAFDEEAGEYDRVFGRNAVGLLFRHVVQERLRALFPPGARVIDLGCGTGEDAAFLASRGVSVHGLDVSEVMLEEARAKAAARGVARADLLVFARRPAEDVAELGTGFDGAYSNFGALNCCDLPRVGEGLAHAVRPGGRVLLSFLGAWPLPALLERALTGKGDFRGRNDPRLGGTQVPARYPSPAEARRLLGSGFGWSGLFGLGVLMPGPAHAEWACRNPQTFGVLAALEGIVRAFPGLRALGDHYVLEGVRM